MADFTRFNDEWSTRSSIPAVVPYSDPGGVGIEELVGWHAGSGHEEFYAHPATMPRIHDLYGTRSSVHPGGGVIVSLRSVDVVIWPDNNVAPGEVVTRRPRETNG